MKAGSPAQDASSDDEIPARFHRGNDAVLEGTLLRRLVMLHPRNRLGTAQLVERAMIFRQRSSDDEDEEDEEHEEPEEPEEADEADEDE
mmetsp:Transcript_60943/g.141964  ORF Transcript_60943/g.141964 Transcript_60943/m.141964 type:complete len:89 (-) Transcript_60943:91-357(-)